MNLKPQTATKRLKHLLIERDLSLQDVADRTGLSISLVKKIAAGDRAPTRRTIERIEAALGARVFGSPRERRERKLVLAPGTEFEFLEEKQAERFEAELGERVQRVGACVAVRSRIALTLRPNRIPSTAKQSLDQRLNSLRRELAVRSEDFQAGRLEIAEAKSTHRATGKEIALLRRIGAGESVTAQLSLLAALRKLLGVQILHAKSLLAA